MANGNGDGAPRRSNGRSAGFHKGSLGSPFQKEYYGDEGMDPGDADYQSGPRIDSGVLGDRVKMNVSKTNGNGRGRG